MTEKEITFIIEKLFKFIPKYSIWIDDEIKKIDSKNID